MSPAEGLPRKVLHVFNHASGGAALSTLGLIRELKARGVACCAVCHDAGTPSEREAITEAVDGEVVFTKLYWWNRKTRVAAWKRPILDLIEGGATGWGRTSAATVAAAAGRWGAELIHSNSLTIAEGGRAAQILGLPHVWHVRELIGVGRPFQFLDDGPRLGARVGSWASLLVANSQAVAGCLRGTACGELIRVVPNGIDLGAIPPRSGQGSIAKPLVVAMIANVTSTWKKHDLFIRAAALAAPQGGMVFRIFGHLPLEQGGSVSEYYCKLVALVRELDLEGSFEWAGHVPRPERIMEQVDIVVHPADGESFGRVAVEAMAAGLPVIGVNGGGISEIVVNGETGLLAPVDDAAGIAGAIKRLAASSELRSTMGRRGQLRAQQLYSIEACAERMLAVYREAMGMPLGAARQASLPGGRS